MKKKDDFNKTKKVLLNAISVVSLIFFIPLPLLKIVTISTSINVGFSLLLCYGIIGLFFDPDECEKRGYLWNIFIAAFMLITRNQNFIIIMQGNYIIGILLVLVAVLAVGILI